jgi:hypothetical protein
VQLFHELKKKTLVKDGKNHNIEITDQTFFVAMTPQRYDLRGDLR